MNKTALIIITFALVLGIGIIFRGGPEDAINTTADETAHNSEIKDGVQYITIDAKGGYSPKVSKAKAGIPTKLIVRTNGTYDCSASLVIRSLGFQKILAQTGEEIINIGTPKADEPLQGLCGMGMYSFLIEFTAPDPQKVQLVFPEKNVSVLAEVADTPEERGRGLGGHDPLSSGQGMWFVFDAPYPYSFWMKDMEFSIDIIWFDENLRIVHIERNVSPASYPETFTPESPAQYVLEVPAGFSSEHDLSVGESAEISERLYAK